MAFNKYFTLAAFGLAAVTGLTGQAAAQENYSYATETVVTEELVDGQWVEISRTENVIKTKMDVPATSISSSASPAASAYPSYPSLPQAAATGAGTFSPSYAQTSTHQRFSPTVRNAVQPKQAKALKKYGPFRIINNNTVEMNGLVDSYTPDEFGQLLRAYPQITTLVMRECPGSYDDAANLRLARMVRAAGISTHVPAGVSIRSGAVELFLAGVRRTAHPSAEFAVHSWRDSDGVEAWQLPDSHPVHQEYLNYYRDMGIADQTAYAFYKMTNSVPFESALYMKTRDMAKYGLIDGTV